MRNALTSFLIFGLSAVAASAVPMAARAAVFLDDPSGSVTIGGTIKSTGTGPQADYGKAYDGPYTIKADYTINFKMVDGKLVVDPATSSVTLTDTKDVHGPFMTLPLTITGATGDFGKGEITSFTFEGTDWYPDAAGNGITNNGLKGTVTIGAKPADNRGAFVASYKFTDPAGETVLKYTFIPIPEPGAWVLMILGAGAIGAMARRRSRLVAA